MQRSDLTAEHPKQCPYGHKNLSWGYRAKEFYCWECGVSYRLSAGSDSPYCSSSREPARNNSHHWSRGDKLASWIRDAFLRPLRLVKSFEEEERQHPRARAEFPVIIEKADHLFMTGRTINISAGGAFVQCWEPLRPGRILLMEFSSAPLQSPIKATAVAVWSNMTGTDDERRPRGMGVQFLRISDADRKIICAQAEGCSREIRTTKRVKLIAMRCPGCKINLMIRPTDRKCPVCGSYLPGPENS